MGTTTGWQRILKTHGRVKAGDTFWLWDYVADEPVKESEMPEGSERWKASEKKRWTDIKERMDRATNSTLPSQTS